MGGRRTNEEENKIPEFLEALQKARLVAETHYSDVGAEASLCPTFKTVSGGPLIRTDRQTDGLSCIYYKIAPCHLFCCYIMIQMIEIHNCSLVARLANKNI